jgi:hypothetical protein
MNRHWKHGFQKNVKNDPYNIEKRLQEYDKDLYLMWNPSTNEHLIMDAILETAVMRIPQIGFETLDSRVLEHIRRIHVINGFDVSWEFKDAEDRRQREFDRVQDDLSYNFAKDIRSAVKQL